MNLKSSLNTVVGLGILVSVFSCQSKGTPAANPSALEVSVHQVQLGNGISKNTYSASIEGITNVEVRPQTSGYLSKIFVDEGAYVHAGQALFKIDDRPFVEQYKTAKAAVHVAEANLKNLKIDLDRKVELVDNKIVSDLQVTQAKASYEASLASLEQARATMNAAKINVDFCLVKAPVSGYIGRIPYRLGSLVNAASVEPLTLLTDINQVYAYFSMSEADFVNFQDKKSSSSARDSVDLILSNGKKYTQKGVIDAVTGQFDKNTGSISIRARFANPNRQLRAGNTGRIEMTAALDDVLLVPIKATLAVQDKIYTYKLDKDNKAEQVELQIAGKTTEEYYVKSGLQAGDRVITGGLGFVRPGAVVKPKK
ncbi:efflux RND transporter periplasmic adaptor subunit [Sphingobacterium athyrii]|uniref:Efflux transporter periplasmic adaptor subunit n=1 Tax=Sphingobacterium athyrii TaxID=2152717 RepID=A0A363P009_9SPHI|nr:efflux RND transporter periplasmic adaptor subunit [Sphingobacterium athyrii]PUV26241.1 efflux transporter periplasmic adaptor subunit [Sphingobacterium athyrii]